ncbi:sugar phosphate isomerase/epimerase family protein [Belliella kenyensis]|uniref:Sugar phosphate isomerase/epimerase family protein n=1 Tax=Belliella kenyensis TaxID=1472724 RepID=A0ABV8EKF4_9BACT|nr:sugar phosphate isomerase/epimerase [Belliella kenyensis]MCH7403145.1 sugar phosphate isomerase/epimerase [Belliella kenyensis]MDN3602314.1 sugar phosphate isomerase/epimerase [Belliella kenyensis]
MKNRRKFLQVSAALGIGALLPLQFCSPKKESGNSNEESKFSSSSGNLGPFGIQLWSVKEDMMKDPKATIEALASYGYKYIESCNLGKGIFWGMKNTEFKDLMDSLNIEIIASHTNTFENLEQQAREAGEIGMKYLINPYVGPQKSMDDFKRLADEFNKQGEICKQNGLKFAYHNHGYTFDELDGEIPQKYLIENTDADLVNYELDLYWVYTAGEDPINWIEKYPNRFPLGHVKDRLKEADESQLDASTLIGEGSIDYAKIINTAKNKGMEYFMVEQEKFDGLTPMEAAEKNANYMRNLTI